MLKIFKNQPTNQPAHNKLDELPAKASKVVKDESKTDKVRTGSGDLGCLVAPLVTEKAALLGEKNKYLFKVSDRVNKMEIKKAVKNTYRVKVQGVNIIYIHPKQRRHGRQIGFKSGYKKAIVTLAKGEKIEEI
jgi:large subunit ribosomal protein L23